MRITEKHLRNIIREELIHEQASSGAPEEVMMSRKEIRSRVKRGDTLVAQYSMEMPAYPRGEPIQVKRGDEFTVSAIGSGKGPDEVIALGRSDISIPPWHLANFDVETWDATMQSLPPSRRG